ncbi:MAG: GntR family transcriptional regulator [Victivallaceae bacterium]|nr:GntR family transcriptional regulator [Victivallaceae bacterium]
MELTVQNKSEKIAEYLRRQIKSGKYKGSEKLPSTESLAAHLGVSKVTVNMAFGKLVAEELIYRKNGSGTYISDSKKQQTKMLGVLLPGECAGEFYSSIIKGINDISNKNGYHQLVKFSGHSTECENKYLKELLEAKVDGIIFCFTHPEHSKSNVEFLIKQKVPFVLVDRHFPELQTDYVGFDNFEAGRMATNYCIEHGHRDIAFVSILPKDYSSVVTRLNGYHSALRDAGLAPNVIKCSEGNELKTEIEALLNMKHHPTAIVTNHLPEVIKAASEKKLEMPQDISVVMFGLMPDPFSFFTYINTPTETMAQKAAEILIDRINTEVYSEKRIIELKPKLIAGNSVTAPVTAKP